MMKIKNPGFTLPEVLITLTIVGALSALIIPGIIKDMNNKAMMSLLQSTVQSLNSAIQVEMMDKGVNDIRQTRLVTDPVNFFKDRLDCVDATKDSAPGESYGFSSATKNGGYLTINETAFGGNVTFSASALLKNGAAIGIRKDNLGVAIDINGAKQPNMIGVDYFAMQIDSNGDIGAAKRKFGDPSVNYTVMTPKETKAACRAGDAVACYYLAETSGFDPYYLVDEE